MSQSSPAQIRPSHRPQCLLACLLAAAFPLTALATSDNWTTATSANFSTGPWSPGVPGSGDTANFNVAGNYTVTFTTSPTNGAFLVEQGNVAWNAGANPETYALTDSPSVTGGSLTLGASGAALTVSAPGGLGVVGSGAAVLSVTGNSTLSTSNLHIGDFNISGFTGTVNDSGNITQIGSSTLTIGGAANGAGNLTLSAGVYNTGTGPTTINATGKLNITGGNFSANGNLTVAGGSLNQTAGTFKWAASQTMVIQSAGNVSLAGPYTSPTNATITVTGAGSQLNDTGGSADLAINNGATLSVTNGGSVDSDQYLDIGSGGNGTVTVDGAGSSYTAAAFAAASFLGTAGTGSLTFSNSATGSAPGGFTLGGSDGSSGTLNVLSNATLNTGALGVAWQGGNATGVINVTGGTLTMSSSNYIYVGDASGGSATITIGASGIFNTGDGLTTINATGQINITGGSLNLNGNLTVTGGTLKQTAGNFTWAAHQSMLIQSAGNVTLIGQFLTPTSATITVTGVGSQLNDTGSSPDLSIDNGATLSVTSGGSVHSDQFIDIAATANGTVTIDGAGSSFSSGTNTNQHNFLATFGVGSLTFSNNATGSAPNGFQIGSFTGSSGTLNVLTNATLTTGRLDIADSSLTATGTINVTGGTLTQTGAAYLTLGQASGGSATLNIGIGGNFTTGTGGVTIHQTGQISLLGGTFTINGPFSNLGSFDGVGILNVNASIANSANFIQSGPQSWSTGSTFTNSAGTAIFTSNAKLYGLTITGGTVDIGTSKFIVEATTNKSAVLSALQSDLAVHSLTTFTLPNNQAFAIVDNAHLHLTTFGGNPADANSILLTPALKGDANLDGVVDIQDLTTVANHWQQPVTDWSQGDFDGNGIVDILDLTAIANNWQAGVGVGGGSGDQSLSDALALIGPLGASIPTPEPASLAILSLATLPLIVRRRRK